MKNKNQFPDITFFFFFTVKRLNNMVRRSDLVGMLSFFFLSCIIYVERFALSRLGGQTHGGHSAGSLTQHQILKILSLIRPPLASAAPFLG